MGWIRYVADLCGLYLAVYNYPSGDLSPLVQPPCWFALWSPQRLQTEEKGGGVVIAEGHLSPRELRQRVLVIRPL